MAIQQLVGLLGEAMSLMVELEFAKRWIPVVGDSEEYIDDRAFRIPCSSAEKMLDLGLMRQDSDKLRSGMPTARVELGGILITKLSV